MLCPPWLRLDPVVDEADDAFSASHLEPLPWDEHHPIMGLHQEPIAMTILVEKGLRGGSGESENNRP